MRIVIHDGLPIEAEGIENAEEVAAIISEAVNKMIKVGITNIKIKVKGDLIVAEA